MSKFKFIKEGEDEYAYFWFLNGGLNDKFRIQQDSPDTLTFMYDQYHVGYFVHHKDFYVYKPSWKKIRLELELFCFFKERKF